MDGWNSTRKGAAFCFWCFVFKPASNHGGQLAKDVYTKTGFTNWKKATEKFSEHEGVNNSAHNGARIKFEFFQNQINSLAIIWQENRHQLEMEYCIRLTAMLDVTHYLLKQGISFRGHDESSTSLNEGNFLELLEWYQQRNEEVSKVVNQNAPGNNQMSSPQIQKELTRACAEEITEIITSDIGESTFALLVDESRDTSVKEQMGVVVRYVSKKGCVIEQFLAIEHVPDTSALSFKKAIDVLFEKHGLSVSRLRGQGYDGASNMRGEFNGLQALILKENPQAMYVHCFSHQLQLVLVAVAKENYSVADFFAYVTMVVNMIGASCKRRDQLRQAQHNKIVGELESGEITSGKGKNQETNLARPGDTRWGSHYLTLLCLNSMWSSVIQVLGNIHDFGSTSDN